MERSMYRWFVAFGIVLAVVIGALVYTKSQGLLP